jgi:transcription elongation factor GreA
MQLDATELQRLKHELEFRKFSLREEIKTELTEAASLGDLYRENFPFDAAVARQRVNENRITDLEKLIRNIAIKDSSVESIKVRLGSKVKLKTSNGKELLITLVDENTFKLNPRNGFISNNSPLGKNLIDRHIGDQVIVQAPIGNITYLILEIE